MELVVEYERKRAERDDKASQKTAEKYSPATKVAQTKWIENRGCRWRLIKSSELERRMVFGKSFSGRSLLGY